MIKLYIDTNIVIDTIDHSRIPEWKYSEDIINLSAFPDFFRLYISMKSIADISYVGGKIVGKVPVKATLKQIMKDCTVIPLESINMYEGLKSDCPDFEDALQISCAESKDCSFIITRDKKHFGAYTDIPVYTPKEFITKLKAVSSTSSTSCT